MTYGGGGRSGGGGAARSGNAVTASTVSARLLGVGTGVRIVFSGGSPVALSTASKKAAANTAQKAALEAAVVVSPSNTTS